MEKRKEIFGPIFWGAISCYYIGFGAASLAGHIKRNGLEDKANERIEAVQEHNTQLLDGLKPDFPSMGRLILNDETDTFEFHVSSENTPTQICKGNYVVVEEEAKIEGDITCTTTVTLGG